MSRRTTKHPVTIVTGFLGSGKTTLLSHVLPEPSMSNTAVLVNEFGKVGLDHHLLRQVNEHTILLGNGCACCTIREDLVKTLLDLLAMDERGDISRLERVVVETSGLADPAPILFTILTDAVLQHHFFVDRVITTVDAVNGHMHLDSHNESLKQVASADKIIVTKTDLVTVQEVDDLTRRLRGLNPSAHIIRAVFGKVDIAMLFDMNGMDDEGKEPGKERGATIHSMAHDSTSGEHHLTATCSIVLTFHEPLDWRAFSLWLSMLLHAHGEKVLRVKGLIDVHERGPVVLNGVQHIIHPPEHLDSWPGDNRDSQIIFIAKGIEPQDILHSFRVFQQALGNQPILFEVKV